MSRIYDNWERLVEATLKRELLRHIALYCESFSTRASGLSLDSFQGDLAALEGSRFSGKTSNSSAAPSNISSPSYNVRSRADESFLIPRSEAEILSSLSVKPLSLNVLRNATGNFQLDNLLGGGGFGYVYKGWIDEPGFGLAIAVKKLKPKGFQDHKKWLTEVNCLGKIRHPNLVKLIGCCSEGDNRLLVYEFLPEGSLKNHLSKRQNRTLSWDTRIKVAVDVARALCFLHDRKLQLMHGDVKASSILLDGDFAAKLPPPVNWSPPNSYHGQRTELMGAYAYTAPEYIMTGQLTAKYDVYSFGVVLIELLCGRCAFDPNRDGEERHLVKWARPHLVSKQKLFWIMDTKLGGQYPQRGAYTFATLAWQCVSEDPKLRPCMLEVLGVLEQLQDSKSLRQYHKRKAKEG